MKMMKVTVLPTIVSIVVAVITIGKAIATVRMILMMSCS